MKPVAVRRDRVARPLGQGLVVVGPNHAIHHLDAVAAWVWQHADGERDIDALLMGLRAEVHGDADRELVFEACDRLADAGLLEKRVAPPTSVSRRVLLERLAGAGAIAALTAVVGGARIASAAQGGLCADEKAIITELAYLEAEQAAVADILDEWVDEAQADDTTDPFYLEALGLKEAQRKKAAAEWGDQLDAAEGDLSECKLAAKQGMEQRKKAREAAYGKAQERRYKRDNKIQEQDLKAKSRLDKRQEDHTKEANAKAEKAAAIPDQAQRQKAEEAAAKVALRKEKRDEETAKQQHVRTLKKQQAAEENAKAVDARYAEALANIEATRLRLEERVKAQAAGYSAKASEEASKQAGVDDRVLEIAQADALAAGVQAEARRKATMEQDAKKAQEQKQKSELQAAEQQEKQLAAEEKTKQAAAEEKTKLANSEESAKKAAEQESKTQAAAEQKAKGGDSAAEQKAKLASEQQAKLDAKASEQQVKGAAEAEAKAL